VPGAASARIETARRYFSRIFFNADITERGRDAREPRVIRSGHCPRQSLIEIANVFLYLGYSAVLKPKSFE
jgi:hypothetical protein